MALLTHAAVKRKDKSKGLFQFWKNIFTKIVEQKLEGYDENLYFSTLLEMTNDNEQVVRLKKFINGPIKLSGKYILTELEKVGVKTAPIEKNISEEYQRKQMLDLVRLLMSEDCSNRYSLSS